MYIRMELTIKLLTHVRRFVRAASSDLIVFVVVVAVACKYIFGDEFLCRYEQTISAPCAYHCASVWCVRFSEAKVRVCPRVRT